MPPFRFDIVAVDPELSARAGILHTPHGDLPTPAFVPVGTQGTVKAVSPRDLTDLGVSVFISNAYHLAMRPGVETVGALGGLHRLAGWSGPLMVDSGGYQVFSLAGRRKLDPDGVTFRSHIDGATHRFTPESVMAIQEALGADLVMPLDVCTGYPAEREQAATDLALTMRWAERSLRAHARRDQLLYGIVQGSVFPDLRAEAARQIAALGFGAFAVGGVSVGETKAEMRAAVEQAVGALPAAAPRHLLGVGQPEDIVDAIADGIDSLDCVVPTRWARHGAAITMAGRVNLRNAVHGDDDRAIVEGCICYACRTFSRGSIRHFVKADEILGLHLLTIHNLHFLLSLVRDARDAILEGQFGQWRGAFLAEYAGGCHARSDR